MNLAELKHDYRKAVFENGRILVVAYGINEDIEARIRNILALYLEKYELLPLLAPLYTCVKELLMNAVKANYKFIFFEGYEPMDEVRQLVGYEKALKVFRLEMNREEARHLEGLAMRNDIGAHVIFQEFDGALSVTVGNPVPMTDLEKLKVSEKLHDAVQCDNISDYFLKIAQDPHREGAGIGLVLVAMILRSLGIGKNGLSFGADSSRTLARLEIPLDKPILDNYREFIAGEL